MMVFDAHHEKHRPVLLVEALAARNDSGLGRHVRLLILTLSSLSHDWNIHVLWPKDCPYEKSAGLTFHSVFPRMMRLWIHWVLPWWAKQLRAQVVLHLGYTIPNRLLPIPSLLLVPDVGPLEPGLMRMSKHDHQNQETLQRQIPKASLCLVSTEFTKKRLHQILSFPQEKICVLPPFGAYTKAWEHSTLEDKAIRNRFPNGFILAVGNVEPRKNYPGLLRGYAYLKSQIQSQTKTQVQLPLVIIGHAAWGQEELNSTLEQTQLGNDVHCLGYVDDSILGAYFRQARIFVTASLYEGFGMPLFEAMCLGKPCIYHAETCQSEFALDGAYSVNANDPKELGQAMLELGENMELQQHYSLRAKAIAQSLLEKNLARELNQFLIAGFNPLN